VVKKRQALRWVMNLSDVHGRLAWLRLRLAEFYFQVEYRTGSSNHAADTMSCLEPPSPTLWEKPVETEIPVLTLEDFMSQKHLPVLTVVDLMAVQQRDPHALA
jgi:hypothetical protein